MARVTPENGNEKTGAAFRTGNAPGVEDLQAQIAQLRGDVETLTGMLRETAEHKLNAARSDVSRKADRAAAEVQQQARHLADTAAQYQASAETAVKNNPGTALGLASGIGFVAGPAGGAALGRWFRWDMSHDGQGASPPCPWWH